MPAAPVRHELRVLRLVERDLAPPALVGVLREVERIAHALEDELSGCSPP